MSESTGSLEQYEQQYTNKKNRLQMLEHSLYKLRAASCALETTTLFIILGCWQEWESIKDQPIDYMLESLPFFIGCATVGTIAKTVAGISEATHKELNEDFMSLHRNRTRTK